MKKVFITLSIIFIVALAVFAYWYFSMSGNSGQRTTYGTPTQNNTFVPLNRPGTTNTGSTGGGNATTNTPSNNNTATLTPNQKAKIPTLRLISNSPVGGYGASTTASTTIVRWVDRGRGNVFQTSGITEEIDTLSNTILPRVYESSWNKNLTAFIGSVFQENGLPSTLYAEMKAQASTTSATPFILKGKNLPENIIGYATSPKKDKLFYMIRDNGSGVGYISTFEGKSVKEIFNTPLTQVNVDWPEENTIAITTKGTASQGGYLYFVKPNTGVWSKIAGPIQGISARVSHDAKYAIISSTNNDTREISTNIYNVNKLNMGDAMVRTIADKCTWGNFYKEMVYCGVPTKNISGTYPDDWYKGNVSFIDKVWQINAATSEVHLISSILDQSDRVIDAFNLGLDPRDTYLFFMNKNDLSLWSLDLVSTQ